MVKSERAVISPEKTQQEPGTGNGLRHPRVLVVEDSADLRDFLRKILVYRGYRFLGAADGIEGINIAKQEHPDLILMDLSLPHLDGLEATRRIKAEASLEHVPVVAVTAHARASDEARAREAGCIDYISKPYALGDLMQLVNRYAPLR